MYISPVSVSDLSDYLLVTKSRCRHFSAKKEKQLQCLSLLCSHLHCIMWLIRWLVLFWLPVFTIYYQYVGNWEKKSYVFSSKTHTVKFLQVLNEFQLSCVLRGLKFKHKTNLCTLTGFSTATCIGAFYNSQRQEWWGLQRESIVFTQWLTNLLHTTS